MDTMMQVTWWDKFLSPLPFMPWIPGLLVLLAAAAWALIKAINARMTPGYDIGQTIRQNPIAVAIFWGAIIGVSLLVLGSFMERAAFGSDRWDGQFRRWTVHWFGDTVDWRQFKAQAMTESALRPHVCSHVGACGLMQIMPGTAAQLGVDPLRPRQAIMGGIRYDRQLYDKWRAPRPHGERLAFTYASYNAGLGHVLRWQRRALRVLDCDANRWPCLLPLVWTEPRQYVERIGRWCIRYGGWGCYTPPAVEAGRGG